MPPSLVATFRSWTILDGQQAISKRSVPLPPRQLLRNLFVMKIYMVVDETGKKDLTITTGSITRSNGSYAIKTPSKATVLSPEIFRPSNTRTLVMAVLLILVMLT